MTLQDAESLYAWIQRTLVIYMHLKEVPFRLLQASAHTLVWECCLVWE